MKDFLFSKHSLAVFFLLPLLTLTISSCGFGKVKIYKDEKISEKVKTQIHGMNQQLMDSIKAGQEKYMVDRTVDEIKKDPQFPEKAKAVYAALKDILDKIKFENYHEYYVVNPKMNSKVLTVASETPEAFEISLSAEYSETYVALWTSQGNFRDPLLALVYVKQKGEWKIFGFHVGVLRIAGKTAMDWLESAKALAKDNYYLPALLRLKVGKMCLRPVPFFHYQREKEWNAVGQKVLGSVNVTFPMELDKVAGKPKVFGLEANFDKTELVPAVQYVTQIPLAQTTAIKAEAKLMTEALKTLIPGIDQGTKSIFYRAFKEIPTDPKKEYTFYGLKVAVK